MKAYAIVKGRTIQKAEKSDLGDSLLIYTRKGDAFSYMLDKERVAEVKITIKEVKK
jgi:hypothetical protein